MTREAGGWRRGAPARNPGLARGRPPHGRSRVAMGLARFPRARHGGGPMRGSSTLLRRIPDAYANLSSRARFPVRAKEASFRRRRKPSRPGFTTGEPLMETRAPRGLSPAAPSSARSGNGRSKGRKPGGRTGRVPGDRRDRADHARARGGLHRGRAPRSIQRWFRKREMAEARPRSGCPLALRDREPRVVRKRANRAPAGQGRGLRRARGRPRSLSRIGAAASSALDRRSPCVRPPLPGTPPRGSCGRRAGSSARAGSPSRRAW